MIRSISLFLLLIASSGCSSFYSYRLATPSDVSNIPADSLAWKYLGGLVTEIAVRDRDDAVLRLPVGEETLLFVTTTEHEEHYFRMQSIVVEDKGEGLLGSTATWRGYDTRQGAERSVMIREVADMIVRSRVPASRRVLRK